jgi:peptidoglycan/LPS O-acetylase OafA/YrhL
MSEEQVLRTVLWTCVVITFLVVIIIGRVRRDSSGDLTGEGVRARIATAKIGGMIVIGCVVRMIWLSRGWWRDHIGSILTVFGVLVLLGAFMGGLMGGMVFGGFLTLAGIGLMILNQVQRKR